MYIWTPNYQKVSFFYDTSDIFQFSFYLVILKKSYNICTPQALKINVTFYIAPASTSVGFGMERRNATLWYTSWHHKTYVYREFILISYHITLHHYNMVLSDKDSYIRKNLLFHPHTTMHAYTYALHLYKHTFSSPNRPHIQAISFNIVRYSKDNTNAFWHNNYSHLYTNPW